MRRFLCHPKDGNILGLPQPPAPAPGAVFVLLMIQPFFRVTWQVYIWLNYSDLTSKGSFLEGKSPYFRDIQIGENDLARYIQICFFLFLGWVLQNSATPVVG